ncbi:MAG TPA: hypothetical protein VK557_21125 [Pyrinomonadaceae bacterium]|nr:hypothetical protein [Pyrinomonadaceae bacterium]
MKKGVLKEDLKVLINEIRKCKVAFALNARDEQEIRDQGKYLGKQRLDDLVTAIRDSGLTDTLPSVAFLYQDKQIQVHNLTESEFYIWGTKLGDGPVAMEKEPRVLSPRPYFYFFEGFEELALKQIPEGGETRSIYYIFIEDKHNRKFTLKCLLWATVKDHSLTVRTQNLGAADEWLLPPVVNPTVAQDQPKREEAKPNIIPVSYGKRHITFDPSTQTFTLADAGILALVAQFRNSHEQGKEISEAKDIRAHIYFEPSEFYKNLDRTVPGFASVEEGIWLNEKSAVVSFARGETKTLILAVQVQDLGFGGFDAFEHGTRKMDDGREIFLPRIPMLTADKYMVKVEIVGGFKGELAELHHFTITLRPEFNISFP